MEYRIIPTNKKVSLPSRGYYTKGDKGEDIGIIASFLVFNFLGYEKKTNTKEFIFNFPKRGKLNMIFLSIKFL